MNAAFQCLVLGASPRRFHFISFHFISLWIDCCWFAGQRQLKRPYHPSIHFISFHFISFHFISFHFISFHFISFHFISFIHLLGLRAKEATCARVL